MTATLPPLIEAYLADLDRALAAADPRERAETLAAVREHATDALRARGGENDAVTRVLDDLGPVDAVAAAATPARLTPSIRPPHERGDGGLLACAVAGVVLFLFPPVAIASLVWAISRLRSHTGNRGRQRAALWISITALALFAVALAGMLPFYFVVGESVTHGPVVPAG